MQEKPKPKQTLCKAQDTPLLRIFQSFLTSLRVWPKLFSALYGNLTTTISLTSPSTILPFSHSVPALLFLDPTRNIPTSGLPPVLSPLWEVLPSGPQIIHPFTFFRDSTESVSLSLRVNLWVLFPPLGFCSDSVGKNNLPAMQETH